MTDQHLEETLQWIKELPPEKLIETLRLYAVALRETNSSITGPVLAEKAADQIALWKPVFDLVNTDLDGIVDLFAARDARDEALKYLRTQAILRTEPNKHRLEEILAGKDPQ